MKDVKALAARAKSTMCSQILKPEERTVSPSVQEAMAQVWALFMSSQGTAWTNKFGHIGEPIFEAWCWHVRDLTPEQIAEGYINYAKERTAGKRIFLDAIEWRRLCRHREKVEPCHKAFAARALPDKTAEEKRRALGKEEIKKIKEKMNV